MYFVAIYPWLAAPVARSTAPVVLEMSAARLRAVRRDPWRI
jgi:hypothetical protein